MLKKTLAVVLALVLMLGGCSPNAEAPAMPPLTQTDYSGLPSGREVSFPLYLFDQIEGKLALNRRDVLVENGQTRAAVAIEALMQDDGELASPFSSMQYDHITLESVQISGNTANVDIKSGTGSYDIANAIMARPAVTNTLIDLCGVEYVNLFINGEPLSYYGMRLGAMSHYSGTPAQYLEQVRLSSERVSYPMTSVYTFYFPDKNNKYLICETREILLDGASDNLYESLVEELLRGPSDTNNLGLVADLGDSAINFELVNTISQGAEGEEALTDQVTAWMRVTIESTSANQQLSEAAVVCTIMSYFQGIEGVVVYFQDDKLSIPSEEDHKTRLEMSGLLGQLVPIYLPDEARTYLVREKIAVPCQSYEEAHTVLLALFERLNAQGEPLSPEDVIDARITGDMVVANFTGQFAQKLEAMEENDLKLTVYAIVNTLTDIYGINRVQLLFDGQALQTVGAVWTYEPLLKNLGLVE